MTSENVTTPSEEDGSVTTPVASGLEIGEEASGLFAHASRPCARACEQICPPADDDGRSGENGTECVEPCWFDAVPNPQTTLLAGHEAGFEKDLHVMADRWL